jgi:uncharacterized protein with PQ loop repeat
MAMPVHHVHKRKRAHQKMEPYPHPDKWKRAFDNLVLAVAFLGVVMTVPQAAKIWLEKDASGVSLISWVTYLLGAVFWTLYGFVHREKTIITIYALLSVVNAIVVVGTVLYG